MTDVSFGQHAAVDGTVRLTVTGEIDMDNAGELEAAVKDALEEPHVEVLILDLDQTGFVDSSGIRVGSSP